MTVTVDVVDSTGLVSGQEAVGNLVRAVLEAEGTTGEVGVSFVDEASIAELNSRYRSSRESTDVLSFDYSEDERWPGEARTGAVSGEIVVCPSVVVRYAVEEGRAAGAQLGWTLIHGALHLAGYDHETDQGEMRERERRLLDQLDGAVQLLALEADT
jgi:probable rRNA maturation factor